MKKFLLCCLITVCGSLPIYANTNYSTKTIEDLNQYTNNSYNSENNSPIVNSQPNQDKNFKQAITVNHNYRIPEFKLPPYFIIIPEFVPKERSIKTSKNGVLYYKVPKIKINQFNGITNQDKNSVTRRQTEEVQISAFKVRITSDGTQLFTIKSIKFPKQKVKITKKNEQGEIIETPWFRIKQHKIPAQAVTITPDNIIIIKTPSYKFPKYSIPKYKIEGKDIKKTSIPAQMTEEKEYRFTAVNLQQTNLTEKTETNSNL